MRTRQAVVKTFSKASNLYVLQSQTVSDTSQFQDSTGSVIYDLVPESPNGSLFELTDNTQEAVSKFIFDKPSYSLSSNGGATQQLIPDTKDTIRLRSEDTDNQVNKGLEATFFANAFGDVQIPSDKTHFYYEQTRCDGVPVFSSYINVHVNKSNQIYAMAGSLAQGDTLCARNVTELEAQEIARAQYVKDFPTENVSTQQSLEYVYSPELLRTPSATNYLSYFISVCSTGYCHGYFVDQGDGTIRKDLIMTADALNRSVNAGNAQRVEGGPATSNQKVNKAYDALGDTWNYYSSKFGRDSYDGRGGLIRATIVNKNNCGWNGYIECGSSYVALDVLAHEVSHGLTQYTSQFIYDGEAGALNEGISDTMAAAIDSDDWLMGEESDVGAIRSLQNPPQFRNPDSMVSSHYYCGGDYNTYVHVNSGVLNKAFYLMSDGGSHKGCQMQGIGRDAAAALLYKALTTYMKGRPNSQYLDMYNGLNSSCGDIYGATSATCANIKVALQSVLMDKPSKCKGGSASTPASCVGVQPGTPEPTGTQPTPTTGTPTTAPTPTTGTQPQGTPTTTTAPTPAPTSAPVVKAEGTLLSTMSVPQFWQGDVKITQEGNKYVMRSELYTKALEGVNLSSYLPDGAVGQLGIIGSESTVAGRLLGQNGDIETGTFIVTSAGKVLAEFSSTQDLTKYDTFEVYFKKNETKQIEEIPLLIASLQQPGTSPAQTKSVVLDMKMRFQGVDRKPASTQAQLVRIGIGGGDIGSIQYKKIVFTAVEGGLWTGRIFYDVPAGDSYKILVKGPKHIQKKYCDNSPKESDPGNYLCEADAITLSTGINTLDLSNVMQLAGDTNQDGRVNARDISTVRSKLGSSKAEDLLNSDLNNDGVVNAVDNSLILYTLANRPQQS